MGKEIHMQLSAVHFALAGIMNQLVFNTQITMGNNITWHKLLKIIPYYIDWKEWRGVYEWIISSEHQNIY